MDRAAGESRAPVRRRLRGDADAIHRRDGREHGCRCPGVVGPVHAAGARRRDARALAAGTAAHPEAPARARALRPVGAAASHSPGHLALLREPCPRALSRDGGARDHRPLEARDGGVRDGARHVRARRGLADPEGWLAGDRRRDGGGAARARRRDRHRGARHEPRCRRGSRCGAVRRDTAPVPRHRRRRRARLLPLAARPLPARPRRVQGRLGAGRPGALDRAGVPPGGHRSPRLHDGGDRRARSTRSPRGGTRSGRS